MGEEAQGSVVVEQLVGERRSFSVKVGMVFEKRGDEVFVLLGAQGARRVREAPARFEVAGGALEELPLDDGPVMEGGRV